MHTWLQFYWRQILKFWFHRQKQRKIKDHIELISDVRSTKYQKYFMKINFKSDDDLPLGIMLSIPVCVIIVTSVLKETTNSIHIL